MGGASKAIGIIGTETDKTMAHTGCNRVDESPPTFSLAIPAPIAADSAL